MPFGLFTLSPFSHSHTHTLTHTLTDKPRVCGGPLQSSQHPPDAGPTPRGPLPLQGGHPHPPKLCRRLQQHGQHPQGDAGYQRCNAVRTRCGPRREGVLRHSDVMLYTIVAKPRTTERKVMSPRAERAPLNTRHLHTHTQIPDSHTDSRFPQRN